MYYHQIKQKTNYLYTYHAHVWSKWSSELADYKLHVNGSSIP